MKIYHNFLKQSGIYKIICLTNNKVYIGSSVNLRTRIRQHIDCLKHNRHNNILLQRSWNKYGSDNFVFELIEYCDKQNLLEREEFYISFFKSCNRKYGFNIHSNPTKGKSNGKKYTKKELKNLSKSHIGIRQSKETVNKIKNFYNENKISNKKFRLYDINGNLLEICAMIDFCKKNNVHRNHINRLLCGEIDSYKGYTRVDKPINKGQRTIPRTFKILNPDGQPVDAQSVRKFCELYNLDRAAICRILNGKSKYHKGWTLPQ